MKKTKGIFLIVAVLLSGCAGSSEPTLLPAEERTSHPSAPITTPAPQEETNLAPSTSFPEAENETGENSLDHQLTMPPGSEPLVELAKVDLAVRLNIDPLSLTLTYLKPITWPDAMLGCGKPGMDFTSNETPGYILQLSAGEKVYTYHSDDIDRVILCPGEGERPDEIFIMP